MTGENMIRGGLFLGVLLLPSMVLADRPVSAQAGASALTQSATEEDLWLLGEGERIAVDPDLINSAWQPVPFQTRYFDIPVDQLEARWPALMPILSG